VPEYLAPDVYVEEVPTGSHPIEGVGTSTTGFVGEAVAGPLDEVVHVGSFSDFERTHGGLHQTADLKYAIHQFFLNGGTDARVVRVTDERRVPDVLHAFDAVESLGLLCLPGYTGRDTLTAALEYCEGRRAFLLADGPPIDMAAAKDLAAALRATGRSNGAVYFPHLTVADPLAGNTPRYVPPAGSVAGLIAQNDVRVGPWATLLSPEIAGAFGVSAIVDGDATRSLHLAGVNVIRSTVGPTIALDGAVTIAADDQWKYVPVRRLLLFIERSVTRGLQWAVFEPNSRRLWMRLTLAVKRFLASLWARGALHGETAADAFLVKCDRDTMTRADLRAGRAVMLVGVAPAAPGDFRLLRVVVVTRPRT